MVEGAQIYGDGVNVAARLESLAEPGGICISNTVHDQVGTKLALNYDDLGEQAVKNIAKPVRVFRVLLNGAVAAPRATRQIPLSYRRGGVLSLAGLAIIIATIAAVQHLSVKPQPTNASIPPAQRPALPLPDKPSIAVLPFINLSDDREQEYFSDGITDDLITDLSRLPGLFVIARESTFTYKGRAANLQDVGRELGVKYVLEGSVRRAAGQVRVTVQLADATTGAELWAERYDRQLGDVFALQDEIVRKIVTTLNLELALSQEGVLIPRTTDNFEAYDDLLQGAEDSFGVTKDGNAKARPLFEKAIELDPNYAEAYALLGLNYWVGWILAFNQNSNGIERALEMEQRAVAIDDSLSLAHSAMAQIDATEEQYYEAEAEARRAIVLDPNSALAYFTLASVLNEQTKPAEALVAVEQAMRLDPRNADNYVGDVGIADTYLGRYKEAILPLQRSLARYPESIWTHAWLARDYSQLGDDDPAQAEAAEVERAVARTPDSAASHVALAFTLNWLGKPAEALVAVDTAIRLDPRDSDYLFQGYAYTLLGRWREAAAMLKPYLARYPNDFWTHARLAIDYMELGHDVAARTEVADSLRLDPEFSVEIMFPTTSLQSKVLDTNRFRSDLRKAGLH
jgi:adenylate cyclase